MGQVQLLLIVLSIILVGVAVDVGMTMFQDYATSSNRDAVTIDMLNLAMKAQSFHRKPASMAGGNNTFAGLTADEAGLAKLTAKPKNANGAYTIMTAGTSSTVILKGVGVEKGHDGNPIQLHMTIFPDSTHLEQLN